MKRKNDLSNKLVVVTGAARGLGKCLTSDLIKKEKARVIAVDIDGKELRSLKEEMEFVSPGSLEIIEADLGDENQIKKTCEEIFFRWDVDGLINNAGVTDFGKCHISRIGKYRKIYDLNVMGTITMSLSFLSHFTEKDKNGFIYNISSMTAMVPVAYQSIYSSSKHALQSFTYGLIEEQRDKNIFIGIFAPGGMQTPMFEESGLSRHFGDNLRGIIKPERVSQEALKNLRKGRTFSTATFFDYMCIAMIKIFPGNVCRMVMRKVYET